VLTRAIERAAERVDLQRAGAAARIPELVSLARRATESRRALWVWST
jgi:hypothetical protein